MATYEGSQDIAATTDTKVSVIARGPVIVSKAGLVLDATFNDATKKLLLMLHCKQLVS